MATSRYLLPRVWASIGQWDFWEACRDEQTKAQKQKETSVLPAVAEPKTLRYAILCEDIAHSTFISETLKRITTFEGFGNLRLEWDDKFPIRANSKQKVEKECVNAAKTSLAKNNDFLVVVRDTDTTDTKGCRAIRNNFEAKRGATKSPLVFVFPVQFIEHWLLYCIHFADNPTSTKNPTFENIPSDTAKARCYTKPGPREYEREARVGELARQYNIEKLHDKCDSFKES